VTKKSANAGIILALLLSPLPPALSSDSQQLEKYILYIANSKLNYPKKPVDLAFPFFDPGSSSWPLQA